MSKWPIQKHFEFHETRKQHNETNIEEKLFGFFNFSFILYFISIKMMRHIQRELVNPLLIVEYR